MGEGSGYWRATHRVGDRGAAAWATPDPASAGAAPLAPRLEVQVVERLPHGWTHVRCENGWTTWVAAASIEPIEPSGHGGGQGAEPGGELDLAWVQMVVPALREPAPPGGYPSDVWAQIPPSYVPADAPTAPSVAPLPAPAPPGGGPGAPSAPRRFPTKVVTLLFSAVAAIGLVVLGSFRARPGTGGAGADVASILMVVLMVAVFAMSLVGVRRPARCRPLLEVLRAAVSLVGVLLLGVVTHTMAPPVVIAGAVGAGVAAGVLEGAFTRVAVSHDRRRYARRAVVPMVVSFAGLLVGVVAAISGGVPGVRFGQIVGMLGIGLMFGVPLGRTMNQRTIQVAGATVGALTAVLMAVVLVPFALGADLASAQEALGVDGRYQGKLVVDPDGASKNFESLSSSVDLRLAEEHLSGTIVSASEDHLNGQQICGYERYTLAGTELQVTGRSSSSMTFAGEVPFEGGYPVVEPDSVCSPQAVYDQTGLSETAELVVHADGTLTGRVGRHQVDAKLVEKAAGGGTSGGGSSGGAGSGGAGTPTSGGAGAGGDEVGLDGSNRPEGLPVPADEAAAAAGAVVAALAGAGVISAAEAAAATGAIARGETPQDVIDQLVAGKDLGKLTPSPLDGLPLPPSHDQLVARAKEKLTQTTGSNHPVFTADEYVAWTRDLEQRFPDASPGTIAAAIHAGRYRDVGDIDGYLPHTGVRLFEQGPATDGWDAIQRSFVGPDPSWKHDPAKKIQDPAYINKIPWYLQDRQGNLLDVNHAMAVLRSDLNRGPGWRGAVEVKIVTSLAPGTPFVPITMHVDRDFMRWVNGDGGDSYQVITKNGQGKLWYYPEYAPPDQRLGNQAGVWLSDFYRNPANAKVPVSDAWRAYLNRPQP